jgi:hypothetical protein
MSESANGNELPTNHLVSELTAMHSPPGSICIATGPGTIADRMQNSWPLAGVWLEAPERSGQNTYGASEAMRTNRELVLPRLLQFAKQRPVATEVWNAIWWLLNLRHSDAIEHLCELLDQDDSDTEFWAWQIMTYASIEERYSPPDSSDSTVGLLKASSALMRQVVRLADNSNHRRDLFRGLVFDLDLPAAARFADEDLNAVCDPLATPEPARRKWWVACKYWYVKAPESLVATLERLTRYQMNSCIVDFVLETFMVLDERLISTRTGSWIEVIQRCLDWLLRLPAHRLPYCIESAFQLIMFPDLSRFVARGFEPEIVQLAELTCTTTTGMKLMYLLADRNLAAYEVKLVKAIQAAADARTCFWAMPRSFDLERASVVRGVLVELAQAQPATLQTCRWLARLSGKNLRDVVVEMGPELTAWEQLELSAPIGEFSLADVMELERLLELTPGRLHSAHEAIFLDKPRHISANAALAVLEAAGLCAFVCHDEYVFSNGAILKFCLMSEGAIVIDRLSCCDVTDLAAANTPGNVHDEETDDDDAKDDDDPDRPHLLNIQLTCEGTLFETVIDQGQRQLEPCLRFLNGVLAYRGSASRFMRIREEPTGGSGFILCLRADVAARLSRIYHITQIEVIPDMPVTQSCGDNLACDPINGDRGGA